MQQSVISVGQFVNHLNLEQQSLVTLTEESFVQFMRTEFSSLDDRGAQVRQDLYTAARAKLAGARVLVDITPGEQFAGVALTRVVCKLEAQLRAQARSGKKPAITAWHRANVDAAKRFSADSRDEVKRLTATSKTHIYRDEVQHDPSLKSEKSWWVAYGGVRFRASVKDVYSRATMATAGELHLHGLAYLESQCNAINRGRVQIPGLNPSANLTEELLETGHTAHFEASSRTTGYGRIELDGIDVGRVRCWTENEPEPTEHGGRVRGGSAKRIAAPLALAARVLRPGEARVVRLGFETVYGLGTRKGAIWLRGTADAEVLALVASRLARAQR